MIRGLGACVGRCRNSGRVTALARLAHFTNQTGLDALILVRHRHGRDGEVRAEGQLWFRD